MTQANIDYKKISQVIVMMLERGDNPQLVAKKVAAYMVSQGYGGKADMLVRSLSQTMRSITGVLEVNIKSRHALTEDVRSAITQLFSENQAVTLSEQIDPSLLGGARIVAGDEVLDVSVRSRINALKQAVKT